MNLKQLIACEDHLLMMTYEENLSKQGLSVEKIALELDNLAIALDSIRCTNSTALLNYEEFCLLEAVEDLMNQRMLKLSIRSKIQNKIEEILHRYSSFGNRNLLSIR